MNEPEIDVETRRAAVSEVLEDRSEQSLDRYFAALGDADWRVRKEAVRVGAGILEEVPFPRLLQGVSQGDNVGLRNASLQLLTLLGRDDPHRLEQALAEVEAPVRKFVVLALGESGVRGALPVLIKALDDGDPHVSAAALDGVTMLGGNRAIEVLTNLLEKDDDFVRIAALHGLEKLRAMVPVRLVKPLLDKPVLRTAALRALGRSADPSTAKTIASYFEKDVPDAVVRAAAFALIELRDSDAQVLAVCEDLPAAARTRLSSLVAQNADLPDKSVVSILVMAREKSVLSSVLALHAADRLGVRDLLSLRQWPEAFHAFVAAVAKQPDHLRPSAMELAADVGVAQCASQEQARDLHEAARVSLSSDDPKMRLAGCRVLLHWGQPSDAPLLAAAAERGPSELAFECAQVLDVLSESDPVAVRQSLRPVKLEGLAGEALTQVMARVSVDDIVERLRAALSSQDPAVRRTAVTSLALVRTDDTLPLVEMAMSDEDAGVREEAVAVLGKLRDQDGHATGFAALHRHMGHEDASIRAAVARGLAEVGSEHGFDLLRRLADDADPAVVVAALSGLRSLGDARSVDVFESQLGHDDGDVVRTALMGLQDAEAETLVSHLVDALDHPAWDVRRIAVELLGESGDAEVLSMLETRGDVEDYDLVCDAIDVAISKLRSSLGEDQKGSEGTTGS